MLGRNLRNNHESAVFKRVKKDFYTSFTTKKGMKPVGGGVHDLQMDKGLPPAFQRGTLF